MTKINTVDLNVTNNLCLILIFVQRAGCEKFNLSFIKRRLYPGPVSPWSRVLEKLIVNQLVKKFPTFCGTRRFITMFTRAFHWFLS